MKSRIISILLALAMILGAFAMVSCEIEDTDKDSGVNTQDGSQSGEDTAATEVLPDVEKKNYDDDFFLNILPDVNPVGYYWVEESKGDIMSDAVYARQEKLKSYLGVNLVGVATGNFSVYIEPFKTAVKNKDGSVDTLISHVHTGINGLIGENYLTDLNEVPGIDLDAEYWNQDFMESISINDRMYLGFSDMNILYTYVVAFNKTLLDQYDDNFDESLYDMVINKRWTLDKMASIAALAYIDTTNDGKTADDQFGIVGDMWVPFCGFLHSSNINLVEMNASGDYEVSVYNSVNSERTYNLITKLGDLTTQDCAWFWHGGMEKISFTAGKTLFALPSTYSLPGYLDYEISFGVLPYPMFDEAQGKDAGYRSLQWGGYICVPTYLENDKMVGETLEMMSYYSADVTEIFYQKLLGKQVAESPLDKQMLDIIWDSVCSDFGQTYYSVISEKAGLLYMVPSILRENPENPNIASFMEKVDRFANRLFKKFIDNIE